jgi:hypothetical protein
VSCAIAQTLLALDEIDRVIVIAPRSEVVQQWAEDFRQVTGRHITKVTGRDGDIHQLGLDVCATWAAIQGLQDALQAVCRAARVLVICDEHHHAAVEAAWGDGADSAFELSKNQNMEMTSMSEWLAIGDETGNWDTVRYPNAFLGVALVMGRIEDWQTALHEQIDGQRMASRLQNPIRHLPRPEKSKNHHLNDAFLCWEQEKLAGEWLLSEPGHDPLRQEVFATLRWLAEHPRLITWGLWGRGKDVKETWLRSNDPAVALGHAYGLLVGQMLPFLNAGDQLLVQPGLRSEPADLRAKHRAALSKYPSSDDERLNGHTRSTVSVLIHEGQSYRQEWRGDAIAGFDAGVLVRLAEEYASLASLVRHIKALNAIADLGAGLLRLSCQSGTTLLRLRRDPTWRNVVFHSLEELNS